MDGGAYLRGIHDTHQGEEDDGEQGSDSQGQGLCTPHQRHEDNGVSAIGFLWAGGEKQTEGLEGIATFPSALKRNQAICASMRRA